MSTHALQLRAELTILLGVHPDTEERRIAMFKDARLRLLMTLAGFERLGIDDKPNATWNIPPSVTARQLHETHGVIQKYRDNPVLEYGDEDPVPAEEMLRRKPTTKSRRAEYDDESEGDGIVSDGDNDFLFPAGGPTNTGPRTATAALEQLKKKRRKRRTSTVSDDGALSGLDEETREQRRKARDAADLEKRKKIKSAEFVYDSDDDVETDKLFFQQEEARRTGQAKKVMEVLRAGMVDRKKRRSNGDEEDKRSRKKKKSDGRESGEEEDVQMAEESSSPSRFQELELDDQSEEEETPLSTPLEDQFEDKVAMDLSVNVQSSGDDAVGSKMLTLGSSDEPDADEDDEDDAPMIRPSRRRQRASMMLESESD